MAAKKTTKSSTSRGKSTSTASSGKRTVKKAVKVAKKHPRAVIAVAVILVVIIAVGAILYLKVDKVHTAIDNLINRASTRVSPDPGDETISVDEKKSIPKAQTYGDKALTFHFLELGNNNTGDCIYIKAGETDILIDAGSRKNSASGICDYVRQYCTDGKLEYVIATHAHQDHIAGFMGLAKDGGVFRRFECLTIIDFARSDQSLTTDSGGASLYAQYLSERDAEVKAGAKHYTALQCYKEADGAQRTYEIGEGMTMTILYQKYYEEDASKTEGEENNYSVCVLFNHGDNYYLFTGDLEADGEASLVESNDLPEVQLFKAGHHGSFTATTDTLLSVIKPKIVCVCCCAGSIEYTKTKNQHTFPAQEFIERVAPYTDKVYVTTLGRVEYNESKGKYEDVGFSSMNGNIVVLSRNGEVTVSCSNNDTLLKDTDWFKANRTCPAAWQATAPPG